jgi:hypothetical protein
LRARISRRRPRGAPGVTSFEVLVGGYISVEFDVLIPSYCVIFCCMLPWLQCSFLALSATFFFWRNMYARVHGHRGGEATR